MGVESGGSKEPKQGEPSAPDTNGAKEKRPSGKDQLEFLKTVTGENHYWLITAENFPDIHPLRLATDRFFTTNNFISGLLAAREATGSIIVKEKLGRVITSLVGERDQVFSQMLDSYSEGETDEDKIAKQAIFRQNNDAFRGMETAIGLGLVDQIRSLNFPALRALSKTEQLSIILRAMRNHFDFLKSTRDGFNKTTGFNQTDPKEKALVEKLDQQIEQAKSAYTALLEEYLDSTS